LTTEIDFSQQKEFPGVEGNRFDLILHAAEIVARIPAPLFGLILLALAAIPTFGNWTWTAGLWAFFLTDWLLLALLPKFKLSYGPSQPPVLILSVLRAVVALVPLPFSLAAQFIGTLLVIYSFYIEPHRIHITHQKLVSPKLRSKTPLRVLHLGDLHVEYITGRERQLLAEIERLKPDLILFSGDVLNLSFRTDPAAIKEARKIMQHWTAPLGSFGVSGSPAVDLKDIFPTIMKDLPVQWLRDQKVTITHDGDPLISWVSPARIAPLKTVPACTRHGWLGWQFHHPAVSHARPGAGCGKAWRRSAAFRSYPWRTGAPALLRRDLHRLTVWQTL
jgi:uncharacterized protein